MPYSNESFFIGHTLRSNKFPKGVKGEDMIKSKAGSKFDLETLGFFDTGSPNYNTYYPDVKAEDLKPQDEDFVYPVYRALSMVRVNKWGPINFGANDALKKSVKKLVGQTVYIDHETSVGNQVGVVMEAWWEEAFEQDGVKVPAGINVRLKIDGKANPKIARGMMMEPPAIHSVSVGIEFKWEQSHPELSVDDFWNKLGTFDSKGTLIERVVVEVVNYQELSAVSHGADPYAQKVNEEGINNPQYAKRATKFSFKEEDFRKLAHHFDWTKYVSDTLTFSAPPATGETIPSNLINHNTENQNNNSMNEQELIFFREKLGLAKDAPAATVMAKLQEQLTILLALKGELETNKTTLTALQAKYPEGSEILTATQKTELAAFQSVVKAIRDEAIKFYNLTTKTPAASITKLIAEGSYETVAALRDQYRVQVESTFEATCNSCGSKNVARASSNQQEGTHQNSNAGGNAGNGTGAQGNGQPKSNAEVVAGLSATIGKPTNGIHEDK